ncbi:hypothetical protein DDB_G0277693 [Dictyostelium discoideum AX4]|uniref:Uncharacterized protein n=1 Tax=Dictyostelium discoideum TaxID=44689 RepID=Q54ZB2_DICDI|nr:hypothetical protein DDB_G0277693 [Dictyostelium discoideum AX4]EAL68604.1 hypothetical protein DDB_G0277693 [Dictyostelium discoideum AX4]|eukprot:XP_642525.1 hypothetical protein DDB_G0277693 [Dictyostelium discoideum AX4]
MPKFSDYSSLLAHLKQCVEKGSKEHTNAAIVDYINCYSDLEIEESQDDKINNQSIKKEIEPIIYSLIANTFKGTQVLNTNNNASTSPITATSDNTPPPTPNFTPASPESILKKPKPIPLRFSTNGVINSCEKNTKYYYLDPRECEELKNKMILGQFILFYGTRSSGKTTTSITVCELLNSIKGHLSIFIDLQGQVINSSLDFWKVLINSIRMQLSIDTPTTKEIDEMSIRQLKDLITFNNRKSLLFNKKDVHLFIDEFNNISDGGEETITQVLSDFREWKNQSSLSAIKSLMVIGTFSILDFNTSNTNTSPFNIAQSFKVLNFQKEEVEILFSKFQKSSGVEIYPQVIDDIFIITNGHKGLVNLVGEIIQTSLEPNITKNVWDHLINKQLMIKLSKYKTVTSMTRCLNTGSIDFLKTIKDILFKSYYSDTPISKTIESNYLAHEGILSQDIEEINVFNFSSNIIKNLVLHHLRSKTAIVGSVPFIGDNKERIDVQQLIINAAKQISPLIIINAIQRSFKKCTIRTSQFGQKVPCEFIYTNEMSIYLTLIISERANSNSRYYISPNNNILYNKKTYRPDLVIGNELLGRYVILEFVATSSNEDVNGHIERTRLYIENYPGATEGWVIHFTMVRVSKTYQYPKVPVKYTKVGIIHIYHDEKYSNLEFTIYPPVTQS